MAHALLFALLAGTSMAAYIIFLRLASAGIHPALGATIVTGVAFAVNLSLTLAMTARGAPIVWTAQSVGFVAIVGLAAACADLFTLSAFASGLKATSSIMISGTSTTLVLLIGFLLLREPFSWTKVAAVGLIAVGIVLLQREGL